MASSGNGRNLTYWAMGVQSANVKYYAKDNTKLGTHSFYAVPVPNGTLTFNEVCEEACRNTSIEPSIMKAAVAEYMKTVQSNVLKGFRVPVGDQFLTVYPNLNASVKDVKDKEGKVTVATDRQQGQEPPGCIGKHQIQPGVRQ